MAKARARAAARKVKDKWKAKNWYQVVAPSLFDNVQIADTLSDSPDQLIGRITEVSLQNLTNDFRKSHIKLFFKIHKTEELIAHTQFVGHTLTSDYLRRMIRRRKSRIDGIYDITTRDGAYMRIKAFATTEKRIQNSQKKLIRNSMKKTILDAGKAKTLNEFIRDIIDGKIGSDIYKNCKNLYPIKRVEIYKTEVKRQPTIEIKDKKPTKNEEIKETNETIEKEKEDKPKKETEDKEKPKTKKEKSKKKEEDDTKKSKSKTKVKKSTEKIVKKTTTKKSKTVKKSKKTTTSKAKK